MFQMRLASTDKSSDGSYHIVIEGDDGYDRLGSMWVTDITIGSLTGSLCFRYKEDLVMIVSNRENIRFVDFPDGMIPDVPNEDQAKA